MTCPRCGKTQKSPIAFCPHDGTKLEAAKDEGAVAYPAPAAMARAAAASPAKRGKICPTCGDRFDANADYCAKDGTHLVLIN
jgi:predicted amidophosphoribosyltransferase